MLDCERTKLTYRYESWRAVSSGILETAGTTFLLLIAVRHFQAGSVSKALVAGAGGLGFILSPLVVSTVESLAWPTAKAAARLSFLGAFSFLAAAAVPGLPVFVAASIMALTAFSALIPLMTQIYQENYPEGRRASLFSQTVMLRIAAAAVFSDMAGRALAGGMGYYRWLLVIFACAFGFAAWCLGRCPSSRLRVSAGTHPFRALRFARTNRRFGRTLVMWMFMGFGNLMMIPLRVEYLANPKYGVNWNGLPLTAAKIALLTGVIPNLVRLVLSPLWGWLFDRVNFFALRVVLNLCFALGILSFFGSSQPLGLGLAAVVFGVAYAGGDVAWSLWVTKFAPPERVADYMAVHSFFTGLRTIAAPLVAFQLSAHWPLMAVSWLSVGLILVSTALLLPELMHRKTDRPAALVAEEIVD